MSREEVIKKAIKRAVRNGYKFPFGEAIYLQKGNDLSLQVDLNEVIFSQGFAKAFFGHDDICLTCRKRCWMTSILSCEDCGTQGDENFVEAWEFYPKIMSEKEDPIKYLKLFF